MCCSGLRHTEVLDLAFLNEIPDGTCHVFNRHIRVDTLASMGVSTLHHYFHALTAMSPHQYQKQLRFQSARSLMLNNGFDAASAAFEVGYESATQFNREYSRFLRPTSYARYSSASLFRCSEIRIGR
jgi:AraC-like DNA-binding protein